MPITQELAAYFSAHGVDPQYLNKTASEIPQDQLAKIKAVFDEANNSDSVGVKDALYSMIQRALAAGTAVPYDPVYVQIGTQIWQMELGDTDDDAWVPLQVTVRECPCNRSRAP